MTASTYLLTAKERKPCTLSSLCPRRLRVRILRLLRPRLLEGVAALAQGLAINTTLQRLGLCSNSLHEAGARSLALALQTNTNLEVLDVRHNDIGRAGVASLSAAAVVAISACNSNILCTLSIISACHEYASFTPINTNE